MHKTAAVLAAFAAATLFFALDVFDLTLSNVHLVPAGLLSLAAGLLIERIPGGSDA